MVLLFAERTRSRKIAVAWASLRKRYFLTGPNACFTRPTRRDFEYMRARASHCTKSFIEDGDLLQNPYDRSIVVDKDHIQRDTCITHPKSVIGTFAHIKEHSAPVREGRPIHEPLLTLAFRARELHHELYAADARFTPTGRDGQRGCL